MLEIAGLPTGQVDRHDDLDTLIDELFIIADELDHRRRQLTTPVSEVPLKAPDNRAQ